MNRKQRIQKLIKDKQSRPLNNKPICEFCRKEIEEMELSLQTPKKKNNRRGKLRDDIPFHRDCVARRNFVLKRKPIIWRSGTPQ
jgi:hypothetical protein